MSLFDLQLGGSWEYKGIVNVDAKVTRSTKEIVLNSKDIVVQSAEVLGKDGMSQVKHTVCSLLLESAPTADLVLHNSRKLTGKSKRYHIRQDFRACVTEILSRSCPLRDCPVHQLHRNYEQCHGRFLSLQVYPRGRGRPWYSQRRRFLLHVEHSIRVL